MISLIAIMPILSSSPWNALSEQLPKQVRLADLSAASAQSTIANLAYPISMGGLAFDSFLRGDSVHDAFAVFRIPSGATEFVADAGIPDSFSSTARGSFAVSLDGDVASSGDVSFGDKPFHIDIPLGSAKSIKIALSGKGTYADAHFVIGASQTQANQSGLRLVSPDDKATVSGSTVEFKWSPVPGATCYGIEIICKHKISQGSDEARLMAKTIVGTSWKMETISLSTGVYQWSVIPFGNAKPVGDFSSPRFFTLQR